MSAWYVGNEKGHVAGPFRRDQLDRAIASGVVAVGMLVREGEQGPWITLEEDRARGAPPSPPAIVKLTPSTSVRAGGASRVVQGLVLALLTLLVAGSAMGLVQAFHLRRAVETIRARGDHPRWEYKVMSYDQGGDRTGTEAAKATSIIPSTDELSALGAEGWEVATSYLEMETAYPNFGKDRYVTGLQPNVRPQRLVVILRRQLSQ